MAHYDPSYPSPESVQEEYNAKIAATLSTMLINAINAPLAPEIYKSIEKRLIAVLKRIATDASDEDTGYGG